uniref:Galactose oxidase n=1 Tax=Rhizophagus irregularis (strain DAOM 181602 / DAOM 197198 / MUCL 43194) TaxID=747089 RepID=U9U583_RHIID
MLKNSLVNFTLLWILLQVLVEVNCQMTPFKPSVVWCHTATLIDNKLYILGGLDLNLTNINLVPAHFDATSVKGGTNNDTLFLYGGATLVQTMALVYTFDSQNIAWSIPKIAGINTRKSRLSGIINRDGKIYLYSGRTANDIANEMLILDTINLDLRKGSLINAPTRRSHYGATLLPDNRIIYIVVIYVHNFTSLNGKATSDMVVSLISFVESDILLLDISNNKEYIWTTKFDLSVPKTSPPPSSSSSSLSPSLPLPSSSQLSDSSSNNSNSNIVGTIVGSLLSGIIFLTIGCFFIYKWNKNRQNHKTINVNNNYNNYSQKEQDIHDYEQAIDNNEQEIIKMPRNENTTNHEPVIVVPANDYHGQEIMQTPKNGSSTNNEPIIPTSAVASDNSNNYNNGRLSSQILKDEILQAVKQEIKNELLQAVRDNNFDITKKKNNARQD